jgi:hypothetical protein
LAKKKKKKSGGYQKDFRQRKMDRTNPWIILFVYFFLFAIVSYPALYLVFEIILNQGMGSGQRLMSSIALGVAGAAYYGVILKAKREGREPRR